MFYLDHRSPIPIYVQLQNQIKQAIAGGVFVPGDQLPSVRELAGRLAVNPNTIARAYQELEREGLIETLRGRGTFVAEVEALTPLARRLRVSERLDGLLREARRLGMGRREVNDLFAERLSLVFEEEEEGSGENGSNQN
ncbi:MAG: GntR family transcriptional regulator [Firmicutes bacterium]|nr:GntR family transcriptional regulator [Bacillota bacterium]